MPYAEFGAYVVNTSDLCCNPFISVAIFSNVVDQAAAKIEGVKT
jgi:hypothetical protein